jgi:sulfite reductase alpha subunit-like flavoprotein
MVCSRSNKYLSKREFAEKLANSICSVNQIENKIEEEDEDEETLSKAEEGWELVNLKNRKMLKHSEDNLQNSTEYEFDISKTGWKSAPQDSVFLHSENDPSQISKLMKNFGLEENGQIEIIQNVEQARLYPLSLPPQLKLITLFKNHLSLSSPPSLDFIKLLHEFCSDSKEKAELSSLCSEAKYISLLQTNATYLSLLLSFPSSPLPPLPSLIQHIPSIQPSLFPVSSPPSTTTLSITIHNSQFLKPRIKPNAKKLKMKFNKNTKQKFGLNLPVVVLTCVEEIGWVKAMLAQRMQEKSQGKNVGNFSFYCVGEGGISKEEVLMYKEAKVLTEFVSGQKEDVIAIFDKHRNPVNMNLVRRKGVFYLGEGIDSAQIDPILKTSFIKARGGGMTPKEADEYLEMMKTTERYATNIWK